MTHRPPDSPPVRLVDILTVVALMASAVVVVGKFIEYDREELSHPAVRPLGDEPPIEAEANLFRLGPEALAVAPAFAGTFGAHPRTLEMYRRLRAYPGAPPRIPHGLTEAEFTESSCNSCHERGGWAARFGAFAPVTPHPEYGSCLQCHAARDELVGRPAPESESAVVCMQCHVDPDAPPGRFREIDWRPASWPETEVHAMPGSPNVVPHEVQTRSNCLACHGGPAAIAALRTDHPERANCRQCHVPGVSEVGVPPIEASGATVAPGDAAGAGGAGSP